MSHAERRERIAVAALQGILAHHGMLLEGAELEAVRMADRLIAALGYEPRKERTRGFAMDAVDGWSFTIGEDRIHISNPGCREYAYTEDDASGEFRYEDSNYWKSCPCHIYEMAGSIYARAFK